MTVRRRKAVVVQVVARVDASAQAGGLLHDVDETVGRMVAPRVKPSDVRGAVRSF